MISDLVWVSKCALCRHCKANWRIDPGDGPPWSQSKDILEKTKVIADVQGGLDGAQKIFRGRTTRAQRRLFL